MQVFKFVEHVFVIFFDAILQVASSNVLVEKMKKSEREVIQDWLENIFKSWEKTNDLEVTLFKFTPLKRGDASLVSGGDDHEWWWWGLKGFGQPASNPSLLNGRGQQGGT